MIGTLSTVNLLTSSPQVRRLTVMIPLSNELIYYCCLPVLDDAFHVHRIAQGSNRGHPEGH